MPVQTVEIASPAGAITTDVATPDGGGQHPVAILCFDAAGRRAAMTAMAERVASWGYVVAVPDLFHRVGDPYGILPPGTPHDFQSFVKVFTDPALRDKFMSTWMASATNDDNLRADATAVLDWLAKNPAVSPGKAAVFGYCMGGNAAMRIAGVLPDRIAALASFHGGGLVTDQPNSPHLRVPQMKCSVYVAGAVEDGSFNDQAKQKLVATLDASKLPHQVETYAGAKHGFAVVDHPTYDEAASERHYAALKDLLSRTFAK